MEGIARGSGNLSVAQFRAYFFKFFFGVVAFLLLLSPPAFGSTEGHISVDVREDGGIYVTVTGDIKYECCCPAIVDLGSLWLFVRGGLWGGSMGETVYSVVFDRAMFGGSTLFKGGAQGCDRYDEEQYTLVLDNTPEVDVVSPSGIVPENFTIEATFTFKPTLQDRKGHADVYIDNWHAGGIDCYTETCTFSRPVWYPQGMHTLRFWMTNGAETWNVTKSFEVGTPCDLTVTSFSGDSTVVDPTAGGTVALNGTAVSASGKPLSWTLSVAGRTFSGTGSSVSAVWDGRDAQGKVVEEGSYTATLTASDGRCSASKDLPLTVRNVCTADSCCKLSIDFGSSANLASGNLNHSQTLFSLPGAKLLGDFRLSYNSLDSYSGVLGTGWTHSSNIFLKKNGDGSYTLHEGSGTRTVLYQNGASFTPEGSAYPVLNADADGTYTLTQKDGAVYRFAQGGNIVEVRDRNANTVSFSYDAGNRLSAFADPSGRNVVFSYTADGRISSIADPGGNTHLFTYTNGMLTQVSTVTPDSTISNWTYTYDSNAFMLTKTDPQGYTTAYTYDGSRRVQTSTDPEGKTRTITYPAEQGATVSTAVTEKDGGVWTYFYDTTKGVLTEKTDPQGNTTRYTYDANRNLLSVTEPGEGTTTYSYDTRGNMTSLTDASGAITTYQYNDFSQVTLMSGPQGTTTYAYDARGNMTSATDPSGATTTYTYDERENMTSLTTADALTTSFTYDQYGNVQSMTDPSGAVTSFIYDDAGNLRSQTDSLGSTTQFEYDSLHRMTKMTDPGGNATTYTYDAAGNRTSITDAHGAVTRYEYNYRGQVTRVTDALGNVTTYTYGGSNCSTCGSGVDKLTSITDAGGNTTTYEYDTLGRLTKETDPSGSSITYGYDVNGNMTSKTDASGVAVTYSYDSMKRLTSQQYPDSSQNVSYTYDTAGRLLSMSDPSGTTTYTFDGAGRILSETKQTGDGLLFVISYSYTAGGSLSSVSYPGGRVVTYSLDDAGRTIKVSQSKDGDTKNIISAITYSVNGSLSTMTFGNGVVTTKNYGSKGALNGLNIGSLKKLTYGRDKTGNITAINDLLEPLKSKTFTYDALYRLTKAVGPWGTLEYAYDPVGNRTAETSTAGTTSYAYTANKLMTSTGAKALTFEYDANGNAVMENQRQYTYNQNQRLIRAVEGSRVLGEYLDNGNGQRVKKTVEGSTIHFLYDQWGNLIGEADAQGTPVTEYIWLGSTPIARVDVRKDSAPPVTSFEVGGPSYQDSGTLYASSSALITLSAVDEGSSPSGVGALQYRLDGGAEWKSYSFPLSLGVCRT